MHLTRHLLIPKLRHSQRSLQTSQKISKKLSSATRYCHSHVQTYRVLGGFVALISGHYGGSGKYLILLCSEGFSKIVFAPTAKKCLVCETFKDLTFADMEITCVGMATEREYWTGRTKRTDAWGKQKWTASITQCGYMQCVFIWSSSYQFSSN